MEVPHARAHDADRKARYSGEAMLDIVLGVIMLLGLAGGLLWLVGLPGEEDTEELAGLVTANWQEVERRLDRR